MNKMQWLNEPSEWEVDEQSLSLFVTPRTDYWRITHYGFVVDDGPFLYTSRSGEFEVAAKLTGNYRKRYDQMGLMIRIDEQHWIKAGIEYVGGRQLLSAVVTIKHSDWSVIELPESPESIWMKAIRRIDAVEIQYSLDGQAYKMMRLAYFPEQTPVKVGMTAASPDGDGFRARFDDFEVKHLPDMRRLQWLDKQAE